MYEYVNHFELKEDGVVTDTDKDGLKVMVRTMFLFGLRDIIIKHAFDYMTIIGDKYSANELQLLYQIAKKLPNVKYMINYSEGTKANFALCEYIENFINSYKLNGKYIFEDIELS